METSKNCVIGSVIAAVIVIGGGIGIYFAVSGNKSSDPSETTPKPIPDPNDGSTDKLFIKSIDGSIKLYDRKTKAFADTKIEDKSYGITSFGPYLDQTIYYATTEVDSVIRSTNNDSFPNLPAFTADWIKTAIAVDDITHKVYVVDRVAPRINVVDRNYQYALPLASLSETKDVILAPESGKMFVLEESKIIMCDMDGTNAIEILKANNLQAMTLDTYNGILYFAHRKGVESYDYLKTKKRTVVNKGEVNVISLAYKDKVLYFINKKGKSSKLPGTSLDNCRLDDSKCVGECCNVYIVFESEQVEQVKIYKTDKPQMKNPCETDNGGCEHLCLLNSSEERRSCACDKEWTLKSDKKTCKQLE